MPVTQVKYKISTLAKELELKNKDLLDIISKAGITGKTQSGSLDETEFNIVMEVLTASHQIDNIDAYMNGDVIIERTVEKVKKEEKTETKAEEPVNPVGKAPEENKNPGEP